jgi:hypothetical protein
LHISASAPTSSVAIGPSAVAVEDRTVSRRHIEIRQLTRNHRTDDLGSVNGSRIGDAWIVTRRGHSQALIHVGASSLRFHALPGPSSPPIGPARGGRIAFVRPPRQHLPAAQPIAPPPRAQGASRRLALDVVAIAVPVLFALLMAVAFDPRFALMGLIGPVLADLAITSGNDGALGATMRSARSRTAGAHALSQRSC